ncbi:MAG: furin-like repeat-containing protein [archaeon]|nr:furin-like repeat-containing protein [archaeon]
MLCFDSQCPSYLSQNNTDKTCSDNCNGYLIDDSNICVDNCEPDQYIYEAGKKCFNNQCNDTLFTIESQMECVDDCPDDLNRYLPNSTCVYPCPDLLAVDKSILKGEDEYNTCLNCKDKDKYLVLSEIDNGCVSLDPLTDNVYLIEEEHNAYERCFNTCKTCLGPGVEEYQNCSLCPELKLYEDTNCVDSCQRLFLNENKDACVEECPEYLYPNTVLHICENCKLRGDDYVYDSENKTAGCQLKSDIEVPFYMINGNYSYIGHCYESCGSCTVGGDNITNNCDSCIKDYYYEEGNCDTECKKYFSVEGSFNCTICEEYLYPNKLTHECENCKDYNNGTSEYFLVRNETELGCRLKEDLNPFYILNQNYSYVDYCYESCQSCSEAGDDLIHNCDSCKAFLLEEGKNCEEQCKIKFKALDEPKCIDCQEYLYSDLKDHECKSCKEESNATLGLELFYVLGEEDKGCIEMEEGTYYFLNISYNYVERCHSNCFYCSGTPTNISMNCLDCQPNLVYENGNCLSQCEIGFKEVETKNCTEHCEEYYYEDTSNRLCINCKLISALNGTQLFFVKEEEDKGCQPMEEYSYHIINNESNYVDRCLENCKGCNSRGTNSSMDCIECKTGFLYENTNCLTQCVYGYKDLYSNNCTECDYNLYPDNKTKSCINCKDYKEYPEDNNTYYLFINETDLGCLPLAENTFYMIETDFNLVGRCFDSCATCNLAPDYISHNCLTCKETFLFENSNCVEHCEKLFKDSESDFCIDCPLEAVPVTDPFRECINCGKNNTFLVNNETDLGCQNEGELKHSFYLINDTFNYIGYCYYSCKNCTEEGNDEENNCGACEDNFLIEGTNCLTQCRIKYKEYNGINCIDCPEIYYSDNKTMSCVNCKDTNQYYVKGEEFLGCQDLSNLKYTFFYLDNSTNYINYCFPSCDLCYTEGNETNHQCETCLKTYLFEDNNCVPKCEKRYKDLIEDICVDCIEEVYPNPSDRKCTDCSKEGKYYVQSEKDLGCREENTLNPFYFVNKTYHYVDYCYSSCNKCEQPGNSENHHCTECKEKLLSENENCEEKCKIYYKDLNEDKCITCPIHLYPNENYEDQGRICQDCSKTNQYYVRNEMSKGCQNKENLSLPFYFLFDNKTFNWVEYCYPTCSECIQSGTSNGHNCLSCNGSLLYEEGNCLEKCQKYFKALDTNNCTTCPIETYPDPNQRICQNCLILNKFYVKDLPNEGCKSPSELKPYFMLNRDYNYIEYCYSTCLTCGSKGNDTNHKCDSCPSNLMMENGNCLSKCIIGYKAYKNNICTTCEEYLYPDPNTRECTNCADKGMYYHRQQKDKGCQEKSAFTKPFFSIMPDYNYIDDCYETCASCTGEGSPNDMKCSECKDGLMMYMGNCTENCTVKYKYLDRKVCQDCEGYYAINNNTRECENCGEKAGGEYFLIRSQRELGCVRENEIPVPFHKFYRMEGAEEEKFHVLEYCNARCFNCSNGGNKTHSACYECEEGYTKVLESLFNGTYHCESKCKEGTYVLNFEYNECVTECPDFLFKDEENKACVSCGDNLEKPILNETSKQCVKRENVSGYYIDNYEYRTMTFNKTYEIYRKCHKNCKECFGKGVEGYNNCKECTNGLILFHNNCIKICPEGFYLFEGQCTTQCPSFTEVDETNRKCLKCQGENAYFYEAGLKCVNLTSLDGYYFVDTNNRVINDCFENCKTCNRGGNLVYHNCLTCKSGYDYNLGNCEEGCPEHKVKKTEGGNVICYTCEELTATRLMFYERECVSSLCPIYSIEEVHQYTDEEGNKQDYLVCRTCYNEPGILYVNGNATQCVKKCEEDEEINEPQHVCIACQVAIFRGKCVDPCPFYTRQVGKECKMLDDQCIIECYNGGSLRTNSSSACESKGLKLRNVKGRFSEQFFDEDKRSYDYIKVNNEDDNFPVIYNLENIFEIKTIIDKDSTWTWNLINGESESVKETYYKNGVNEKVFVLNPFAFRITEDKNNWNQVELKVVKPKGEEIIYKVNLTVDTVNRNAFYFQKSQWNGTDLFLSIIPSPSPAYQQILEYQYGLFYKTKYNVRLPLNAAYVKEMKWNETSRKEVNFVGRMPTLSKLYIKILNCYGAFEWLENNVTQNTYATIIPNEVPDREIENDFTSLLNYYAYLEEGTININITDITDDFLMFFERVEEMKETTITYPYEDILIFGLEMSTVNLINQIEGVSLNNETADLTIEFMDEIFSLAYRYINRMLKEHFVYFLRAVNILYKGIITVLNEDEYLIQRGETLIEKLYQLLSHKVYPNLMMKADLEYITMAIVRIGHSDSVVINREEKGTGGESGSGESGGGTASRNRNRRRYLEEIFLKEINNKDNDSDEENKHNSQSNVQSFKKRRLEESSEYFYDENIIKEKKLGEDECSKSSLFCLEKNNMNDFKSSKVFEVEPIENYYLSLFSYNSKFREKNQILNMDQSNTDLLSSSDDLNDDFSMSSQVVFRNADIEEGSTLIQNCIVERLNLNGVEDDQLCFTYFDYENKEILCKCNLVGTIRLIDDEDISNRAREIQYKMNKYDVYNYICYLLIGIIIFTTLILSILLLFFDYVRDSKINQFNKMKEAQKILYCFPDLCSAGVDTGGLVFLFMKYHFSIFQIIYVKANTFPRYIKLHIEVFSFLAALIFSIWPFYIIAFYWRDEIVERRDYESIDYNVHNLPLKVTDLIIGIVSGFVALIMQKIIICLLNWIFSLNMKIYNIWNIRHLMLDTFIEKHINGVSINLCRNWAKTKVLFTCIKTLIPKLGSQKMLTKEQIEQRKLKIGKNNRGSIVDGRMENKQRGKTDKEEVFVELNDMNPDGSLTSSKKKEEEEKKEEEKKEENDIEGIKDFIENGTCPPKKEEQPEEDSKEKEKEKEKEAQSEEEKSKEVPNRKERRSVLDGQEDDDMSIYKDEKAYMNERQDKRKRWVKQQKNYEKGRRKKASFYCITQVAEATIEKKKIRLKDYERQRDTGTSPFYKKPSRGDISIFPEFILKTINHHSLSFIEERSKIQEKKYELDEEFYRILTLILSGILLIGIFILSGILWHMLHLCLNKYNYYIFKVWLLPALVILYILRFGISFIICFFLVKAILNSYKTKKRKEKKHSYGCCCDLFVPVYGLEIIKCNFLIKKYYKQLSKSVEKYKDERLLEGVKFGFV